MEGRKSKSRVILAFGAPCSGKTTFCEKFSAKYNLAYYNLDEVVSEYHFEKDGLFDALKLIAKTKHTLVIEGGIDTEAERVELKELFTKTAIPTIFLCNYLRKQISNSFN